jgi:hypothetical protein
MDVGAAFHNLTYSKQPTLNNRPATVPNPAARGLTPREKMELKYKHTICPACNQKGHNFTWKQCPKYDEASVTARLSVLRQTAISGSSSAVTFSSEPESVLSAAVMISPPLNQSSAHAPPWFTAFAQQQQQQQHTLQTMQSQFAAVLND